MQLLRDAASYRLELLRGRVALRYRRIVVRAEGRQRVEAVVHSAVDGDWRVIPGTEERVEVATYTDTYVRREGTWSCIQAQVTPVSEAHHPGDDTIVSVYPGGRKQTG